MINLLINEYINCFLSKRATAHHVRELSLHCRAEDLCSRYYSLVLNKVLGDRQMNGLMWFDVHLIKSISGIECHEEPVMNCRAAEFMLLLFIY